MKNFIFILTLCFNLIISRGFSQDQRKLKLHLEGAYQIWNDQTYFAGIGAKMTKPLKSKLIDYYDIHVSMYYEKYLKPDFLNTNYSWNSRVAYEFKYFLIGLSLKNINWLNEITGGSYRIDIVPEFGFGYKYFWLTYSRDFLIYQVETYSISPDNFRFSINIPLFDIKINTRANKGR